MIARPNRGQGGFDFRTPFQRQSATSREAARAVAPSRSASDRARVLTFLRERGDDGATDEEIQAALALDGSTERPRRVSLVTDGLVLDSGRERPTKTNRNATVWQAAPAAKGDADE